MTKHIFHGQWITDAEFASLAPRNVFHRQLEPLHLPCDEHRNRHILFRRRFTLDKIPTEATMYITADDYYKLWINGSFVTQGPAPAYPFAYGYNTVDVTPYLREGDNVIAVHTLYQGLINRVWVSGDQRHGLLCDLIADDDCILTSDASFLTHPHTGYTESGTVGYATQFLERYDARAAEVGFEMPDYDDSGWDAARPREVVDTVTVPQKTASLVFEDIAPTEMRTEDGRVFLDFGSTYVGYLRLTAQGCAGDTIVVRCAQELEEDGSLRWKVRANCPYEEEFVLRDGLSVLDWFDYKAFRYAELILPDGVTVSDIRITARHYPFTLRASMRSDYTADERLREIWQLCVHSQEYGVQEVIQDCMEREKGFYVGDGCYTALANLILTGDDAIVRKLIDDAFRSTFITPSMVTCLDCSMMQEITEYPLMLLSLILWHYRIVGDRDYLATLYPGVCTLLDSYRSEYEHDNLLSELNKWCVVEWPGNFRDGYDVDIREGHICHEPHVAINAYYIEAVRTANKIAAILGLPPYRDDQPLVDAFHRAFYDEERHLFRDSDRTEHISLIGNIFPYAFGLEPNADCTAALEKLIVERGISALSMFGSFPLLYGLIRHGREGLVRAMLTDEGAWLRMLREGATTTWEAWAKELKPNTSLFHLTYSDASVFLADIDHAALFA